MAETENLGMARFAAVVGPSVVVLAILTSGCDLLTESPIGVQLRTGAGLVAKQHCSLVFVSELQPERVLSLLAPILGQGASVFRTELDRDAQVVTARVPGILRQTAVHREGYGCTLLQDERRGLKRVSRARKHSRPLALEPGHRDEAFDPAKLKAAVDRAFEQDPGQPPPNTLAVVVLHEGSLVAERYAEGITRDTRLPGWSMTKSVVTTLIGVLAHQGRLDVHAPGAVREWRETSDPRSKITLDHLLRNTSGLAIGETTDDQADGRDPNSIMHYHERDAAHFAATRELVHDPGSHFEYMSGGFVLATRAAQELVGETLEEAVDFIHQNLFGPLGMHSAVLEADQSGTLLGGSHLFMMAQDWARFGQLYLNNGVAGGRRLFSEDWFSYVTTPTPGSRSGRAR